MNGVKTVFHLDERVFLRQHALTMTNRQLLDAMNANRGPSEQITLTVMRNWLYANGMKRMNRMPRWKRWEVKFLRENWTTMGDVEIARKLNEDPREKSRRFTRKHVWTKRFKLLKLKRSSEQIESIVSTNENRLRGLLYGRLPGIRKHLGGGRRCSGAWMEITIASPKEMF